MDTVIRRRLLIIIFISLAVTGCTARLEKKASLAAQDEEIPYASAFARDRDAGCGFSTPKQAAAEFMRVLFACTHDLLRDDTFKKRFFSATLRREIAVALKQSDQWPLQSGPGKRHPAAPDPWNKTIFNVWDNPTNYTVSSGYQSGQRAVVDVVYQWGPRTQYPGERRNVSVILGREGGKWYVDDLYTHNGDYCSASSFYSELVIYRDGQVAKSPAP